MGRKVAEATNASRMRRTRGDMGRLCFFTVAECIGAVALPVPAGLVDLLAVAAGFVVADL